MSKEGSTPARGRFPSTDDERLWSGAPLDLRALFSRDAPREVEIGSGKARFLIEAARRHPDRDFLGVEMSLAYYRLCRERLARSGLSNVRIYRAEGRRFVEAALPAESVSAFHVYFPDPWPKKRQRKRRLLDGLFLDLVVSRLLPGGILRIATDHPDYGAGIGPLAAGVPGLEALPWEALAPPPPTHYELKYAQEGRAICRFLFRKR